MSSGGGGQNTTTSSSAPNPQFLAAYQNVLGKANAAASAPLQQYQGSIVAPLSADQQAGIAGINSAQGVAAPYISQAASKFGEATQPIWNQVQQYGPNSVSQYESPYTQQVVNATQAEFDNQNKQQAQGLSQSAVTSGAYGGDREAIAQSSLAGQQQTAQAPVIAGLENTGFQTAQQEFNAQQQAQIGTTEANSWLNSQAAFGLASLGQESQSTDLTGANALLSAGGLQQQLNQEQLNVPYEQFQAQQAYPFQTTNFLSGIAEGASALGGSGTSTAYSTPSTLSTVAGLGSTALGAAGLFGGFGGSSSGGGYANGTDSGPGGGFLNGLFDSANGAFSSGGFFGNTPGAARGGGIAGNDNASWTDEPTRATGTHGGGGLAGRDMGGSIPGFIAPQGGGLAGSPVSAGVPDISVNDIPVLAGQPGNNFAAMLKGPQSTTTSSGGGSSTGSDVINGIKTAATIASFFAKRGGGIAGRADGGDLGEPVPLISTDDDGGGGGGGLAGATESSLPVPPIPPPEGAPTAPANVGIAGQPSNPHGAAYDPSAPIHSADTDRLRAQAPYLGLLSAGLATLGGHGNGVQNIGAGGEKGIAAYEGAMDRADKQDVLTSDIQEKRAGVEERSRQLDQQIEEARTRAKHDDAALAQTAKYQDGELGLRGQQLRQEAGNQAASLALRRQEMQQNLIPADVRVAQWMATASPEQKAAYANSQSIKRGEIPLADASMFGGKQAAGSPAPAGSAPSSPPGAAAATTAPGGIAGSSATDPAAATGGQSQPLPSVTASPAAASVVKGDDFLQKLPPQVQPIVKAIAEGRMALPTRLTPQTQQLISLAGQYDPTFDQTDYNKRNKTASDFSAGQSGKAVGAINTAMAHLDTLDQTFTALGNGDFSALNGIKNWWEKQTGDPAPNNAEEARNAVANELRKVFATSGGGGLEELKEWQSSFPVNGSPAQQQESIRGAIKLMDGRLASLADRYSVGMGTQHDGIELLSPQARTAYQRLTGLTPEADATQAPVYGQRASAPQAAVATPAPVVIPPMQSRTPGSVYQTPKGPMSWTGTGWVPHRSDVPTD